MANFYNQTTKAVLADFHTNPDKGLTEKEVIRRREKYGPNLIKVKETPLWRKILEPFLDIFMGILILALILSLIQQQWTEVIMIAVMIFINAIIYYIQQFSTDRILRALKQEITPTATVLRDGAEQEIATADLVPGDIVILQEGDRIPADGRILVETGLLTNESMLTGESEPVDKDARAISGPRKIYARRNMVFSGSFVITGTGRMIVVATGNDTEYGRITSLASTAESTSPIQAKISRLVFWIAIIILILSIITLIVQLIDQIPLLDALKFTLALIVSAIPEGLPLAISIILALGAKRMAKKHALIKEMRAIQSIGIVTTIACDKTGTLTENKLSLQSFWSPENNPDLPRYIAESAIPEEQAIDPLDIAIWQHLGNHKDFHVLPLRSYAFDQKLKMSGNLFATDSSTFAIPKIISSTIGSHKSRPAKLHLTIKGAPETILDRCKLPANILTTIETKISDYTSQGYKVMAIATATPPHEINELHRLDPNTIFHFQGLIATADALRPGTATAIRRAKTAGVKVKMITGDHAKTAYAIGRELGIANRLEQVLDCSKLGFLSDQDLADAVKTTTIFARVTPEDKFRLLTAIKRTEIAAMTGDGVNDVPALANAHVGIAMGDAPSIVQDASDIVLLDNNFKNIISAMQEGRIILANIRRMLIYLLATNAGEVLIVIATLIVGGEQILVPIQILWINLVTDSLMVIPIGLEPLENHYLHQKPEDKNAPILAPFQVVRMLLITFTMAAVTLATYFISLQLFSHEVANTLAFTAIVVTQWANAFTGRGTYEYAHQRLFVSNKPFLFAFFGAILLQVIVTFTPLRTLVSNVPVPPLALLIVIIASFIIPFITVELHKYWHKHKH